MFKILTKDFEKHLFRNFIFDAEENQKFYIGYSS